VSIITGDARTALAQLPAASIQACVTSPPYYNLRDYGRKGQIGLEKTPDEYVAELVNVFREVKRVLRDDGTVWLNLGDSYVTSPAGNKTPSGFSQNRPKRFGRLDEYNSQRKGRDEATAPKNLLGIPWRVAFALQAGFSACDCCGTELRSDIWPVWNGHRICPDCKKSKIVQTEQGWTLRSAIVWCLSGGTRVYARTQKGEAPMTIKDMVRLDPSTVKLWNGEKWTQVLGWGENPRPKRPIEIVLCSGERVTCTPEHVWPTKRGNVRADELRVGDIILTTKLPEPERPVQPSALDDEMVGWFIGLYLAEGSRHGRRMQIAGHVKETARLEKLAAIAEAFGGSFRSYNYQGNELSIRLEGLVLNALLDTYLDGTTAKDKHLKPACWARSDKFLRALLDGYLAGDGHYDASNDRWRIGFTRNYSLEADMRTLCARLDIQLRLKPCVNNCAGKSFPGFKGEIRFSRSFHYNRKNDGEVVELRNGRARKFWDISVEDEPHLFALASGVLTHNCKPNPMPESVRDRPTSAYEHVFLFAKQARYFYDADAIRETAVGVSGGAPKKHLAARKNARGGNGDSGLMHGWTGSATRNARNVWTITPTPLKAAHFAVMPLPLAERCLLAGTKPGDVVIDPFGGAGTVAVAAVQNGRRAVLVELNPAYVKLARARIAETERATELKAAA
jgi:DNA modification methylase